MRQRTLQIGPQAGHVPQILRLAVAPLQPGEYPQYLGRALRRQCGVKEGEAAGVEAWQTLVELGRDRRPGWQIARTQRCQAIDGGGVTRSDWRRRIARDDALITQILHQYQAAIEIGVQDFGGG